MRIAPVTIALVVAGAAVGVTAATASAMTTSDSGVSGSGQNNVFIVGGQKAGGDTSFAVALLFDDGEEECTGSLISSQWVVTAKHCLDEVARVRVGSKTFDRGGTLVNVAKTVNGPDDLGLVKLSRAVQEAPIGIAPSSPAVGSDITVMGWGQTSDPGDASEQLKQLTTSTVQDSRCSSDDIIPGAELCLDVTTSQTPCFGDSGGPAIVDGLLVGADSRGGNRCGDSGGEIYSDVTSHLSFIEQKTGVQPAQ